MTHRRSRFTLIFINFILTFALCAKPISSQGKEEPPPPSLPKIDLQKSLPAQNGDNTKVTIGTLGDLKLAIENYKAWFPQMKACGKVPEAARACYGQCEENYGRASDFATVSIESLNNKDLPNAKCDIGNIATNIQKCQDCFDQTVDGGDKAMTDINMWVKGFAESCLDLIKEAENGVQKLSVDQNDKEDPPPPSLPKIDLQKSLRDQNGNTIKVAIEALGNLKPAIEDYKTYFPERKACWKSSQKAKHCYDQCEGDYCVASDFTTGGIESLNNQDLPKAKCDIGNVATNIQKCQDCFEQTGDGQDQVITDINMWVKGLAVSCLDMLKEAENGVQKLSVDQNDATKRAIEQLEGIKHDL